MPPTLAKPPLKNWGVAGKLTVKQISLLTGLTHLNPFIQCRSPDGSYTFIEFWSNNQSLILEEVLRIIPEIQL